MDVENIKRPDPLFIEPARMPKKSLFGKPLVWLQILVFFLGLGLLFFVIYKAGFKTLGETLSRVGWGFLLIIGLNGARHLLRSLCLYLVVPPRHRLFKYRQAVAARLGGEAVSFVTFTGPLLGEATKAALLKGNIPFLQSSAAIIVDNILYYFSVILIVLGGVGVMSVAFSNDASMKNALLVVTVLCILAFTGLFLMLWFRIKPVGFVIRRLMRRDILPKFLDKKKEIIFQLEHNVYEFYLHHRATFFAVFGINMTAHALSIAEVYFVLKLLEFTSTVTIAFIIESLTKVINLSFSFIPGGVGVYEGGNGVILHTLGYATAAGVALALVRRGAILSWTFVGLLILLWRTILHGKQRLAKTDV
jgi:glycosyltransferase 2 family protein